MKRDPTLVTTLKIETGNISEYVRGVPERRGKRKNTMRIVSLPKPRKRTQRNAQTLYETI